MNRLKTVLATSVVMFTASTAFAHASTIDITLGATSSDISYITGSNALDPNLNLALVGPNLVLNNNAYIISPPSTIVNQYIQPSGTLYGNNYLAVLGIPTTGSATFDLATLGVGLNKFAFTWGTLDAYNTLTLTDARNVTYTITGADILNLIAGSVPGTTQANVSIVDPNASFLTAQLSSSSNSFEAGNFSATDPSTVPLPPALPLFAAALISFTFFARRKIIS